MPARPLPTGDYVPAGGPPHGPIVFRYPDPGSFECARSGFADYARDGETAEQLRACVNRVILEDLEQKVVSLRALYAKLRDLGEGENFGGTVARARRITHRFESEVSRR